MFWIFVTIRRKHNIKEKINSHILMIVFFSYWFSSNFWCWIIIPPQYFSQKQRCLFFKCRANDLTQVYNFDNHWYHKEIVQMDNRNLNASNISWSFWKDMSRKAEQWMSFLRQLFQDASYSNIRINKKQWYLTLIVFILRWLEKFKWGTSLGKNQQNLHCEGSIKQLQWWNRFILID